MWVAHASGWNPILLSPDGKCITLPHGPAISAEDLRQEAPCAQ